MIIQNSTPPGQVALPGRHVSDDAPKVVANTQKAKPASVDANQQPSAEQLKSAVSDMNKAMRQSNRSLEFSVDGGTNKPVVKLVDSDTGELIRQIPSEDTLAIARSIDKFQHGLILRQQA